MFCEKCGAKIDDNAKFCDNCGVKIGQKQKDKTEIIESKQEIKQIKGNSIQSLATYQEEGLRNILTNVSSTLYKILQQFEKLSKYNNAIDYYIQKANSLGDKIRSSSSSRENRFNLKSSDEFLSDDYKEKFKSENKKKLQWYSFLRILAFVSIPITLIITLITTHEFFVVLFFVSVFYTIIWVAGLSGFLSAFLHQGLQKIVIEVIADMRKEVDKIHNTIESFEPIIKSPPVSLIPFDYRNPDILATMAHYIENMEASTWKECVAIWKADKHRDEIMAKQEEIRQLAEQTAISASVTAQNSEITAKNSQVTAHNSNIAAKGAVVTAINTTRTKEDLQNVLDYFSK